MLFTSCLQTPEVIRVVHLSLRQDAKVLAAEDGFKGLELARKHLPSLIITDPPILFFKYSPRRGMARQAEIHGAAGKIARLVRRE